MAEVPLKTKGSRLTSLPEELLTLIMVKVAGMSAKSWGCSKLSCKTMQTSSDKEEVLKSLKLNGRSNIPTNMMCCLLAARNPEAIYREALDNYFVKGKTAEAFELFQSAIKGGHHEAPYTLNFCKLFNPDDDVKIAGRNELTRLKRGESGLDYIIECRYELNYRIKHFELFDPDYLNVASFCPTIEGTPSCIIGKGPEYDIVNDPCPNCVADVEIYYMTIQAAIRKQLAFAAL